uniref:Putative ovule protein n=1 Tax=Solanum chacoense TaxID=4108 RepID=A0A0V0GU89_SOLCH
MSQRKCKVPTGAEHMMCQKCHVEALDARDRVVCRLGQNCDCERTIEVWLAWMPHRGMPTFLANQVEVCLCC